MFCCRNAIDSQVVLNDCRLHWLEAEGTLDPFRSAIEQAVAETQKRISGVTNPPRLDILVRHQPGRVIPEIGIAGRAYSRTTFALSFDADNPNLIGSIGNGTLHRQIAHEVHHCLRMAGPGYGRTLGEALVSEGLAGQFVRYLFGNPPEPWECAVDEALAKAHFPDAAMLALVNYDHASWFFGKGGRFPRWPR